MYLEQWYRVLYKKERQPGGIAGYKDWRDTKENLAVVELELAVRIARKLLDFARLNPGGLGVDDDLKLGLESNLITLL